MAKMTVDSAQKLIRQLQDEKTNIYNNESGAKKYSYIYGETPIVPEYDFEKTFQSVVEIDQKIMKLKHAINEFNVSTRLPEPFESLTVDTALVYLAMMSNYKDRLLGMRTAQKKVMRPSLKGVSEITAINYDPTKVEEIYKDTVAEITGLQQAITKINFVSEIEVNL